MLSVCFCGYVCVPFNHFAVYGYCGRVGFSLWLLCYSPVWFLGITTTHSLSSLWHCYSFIGICSLLFTCLASLWLSATHLSPHIGIPILPSPVWFLGIPAVLCTPVAVLCGVTGHVSLAGHHNLGAECFIPLHWCFSLSCWRVCET